MKAITKKQYMLRQIKHIEIWCNRHEGHTAVEWIQRYAKEYRDRITKIVIVLEEVGE